MNVVIPSRNWCWPLALAWWCSTAVAGYAVIDDDLLPSASVQARKSSQAQERFEIPFPRERGGLTHSARTGLDMLVPRLTTGTVRIVGRPDAVYAGSPNAATLASARANSLRDYLVRRGIPAESITVEIDTTPNPQANGSMYPSDLYLAPLGYSNRSQANHAQANISKRFEATRSHTQAPTEPAFNESALRLIHEALRTGQISAEIALQMLRSLGASPDLPQAAPIAREVYRPQPAVVHVREASQPIGHSSQAAPTEHPTWQIRKSLTLRQNLESWARIEGYDVVWELPPTFNPALQADSSFAAPSFNAAIDVLVKSLHAKGYTFLSVNIYSDRVVQFTTQRSSL